MTSTDSSQAIRNRVLVLCGVEERLHIVLGRDERDGLVLETEQSWAASGHSMTFLSPAIEQALRLFGTTARSLRGIACVRGPGSFTGIRIVMSTALGLSAGAQIELAGLDYLPLLAENAPPLPEGTLAVMTYARRGQVYFQTFDALSRAPLGDIEVLRTIDAAGRVAGLPGPVYCLGSGFRRDVDLFLEARPDATVLPRIYDTPRGEVLLAAAERAEYSLEPPEPHYIRLSDAEENLPKIAEKRGISTEDAERLIHRTIDELIEK